MVLPNTLIFPAVGRRNPQMHFISTVLPLPFRPMMPWIFPRANCKVTFQNLLVSERFADVLHVHDDFTHPKHLLRS